MNKLLSLALAAGLAYVIGDFVRPYLPSPVAIALPFVLGAVIYKLAVRYLDTLSS